MSAGLSKLSWSFSSNCQVAKDQCSALASSSVTTRNSWLLSPNTTVWAKNSGNDSLSKHMRWLLYIQVAETVERLRWLRD